MFGTLIESRHLVQRRTGGSLISVAAHGVLIAAAAVATTHRGFTPLLPDPPPVINVTLDAARPTPHEVPAPSDPTTSNPSAIPPMPTIEVPPVIPTEIPTIDFSAAPTPADFNDARARQQFCAVACPAPRGSGTGDSTLAVWAATELQMRFRDQPIPPRYPERLRAAGVEGRVLVRFIVDTTGRIDAHSVEVMSSDHDLFAAAVRDALGRMRFNPAEVDGRRVRAAAIMPFVFTLR